MMHKRFTFLLAIVLLSGCSTQPSVVHRTAPVAAGDHRVYITNHGWHTGIVISANAIQEKLPRLQERFPDATWLEFGWGDKDFYQAREMSKGLAMQAVLWPTDSVVRVVAVRGDLANYFAGAGVVKLCLDEASLTALVEFLADSFATRTGDIQPLHGTAQQIGNTSRSQFYAGTGQYHLMNTCNTWTAKGLKSAGMAISTTFRLTADSVMDYLHQHPRVTTLARKNAGGIKSEKLSCP